MASRIHSLASRIFLHVAGLGVDVVVCECRLVIPISMSCCRLAGLDTTPLCNCFGNQQNGLSKYILADYILTLTCLYFFVDCCLLSSFPSDDPRDLTSLTAFCTTNDSLAACGLNVMFDELICREDSCSTCLVTRIEVLVNNRELFCVIQQYICPARNERLLPFHVSL